MQRHDMIDAMRGLGLKGMAGAFDEAVTTALQRQRTTMGNRGAEAALRGWGMKG